MLNIITGISMQLTDGRKDRRTVRPALLG